MFYGIARRIIFAILVPLSSVAGAAPAVALNIGYYEICSGEGKAFQTGPIVTAGHTPVLLSNVSAADLAGIDVAFVTNCGSPYASEWYNQLGVITAAVNNGLVLVVHDTRQPQVGAGWSLPGTGSILFLGTYDNNIEVKDNTTLVTNGPGGVINNLTLDGGNYSLHGFAELSTLPAGSRSILSREYPTAVVTFSFPLGQGHVIFSSIPLDYFLSGFGPPAASSNFRNIYAPNVVAYAATLVPVRNGSPIASAGPDQTVDEGSLVGLDASGSSDPDNDPLSFSWTQTGGPLLLLNNPLTRNPTFQAPFVSSNQTLTFQLTVRDPMGHASSDFVDVAVVNSNLPPIADAGDPGTVKEGAARILDGTHSYDPNGEPLVDFQWGQIAGPTVALVDATSATPTFVAPAGAAGQSVTLALVVSDGKEASEPSLVTIGIVENSAPVADAGLDQTKDEGQTVTLVGSGVDPDIGDLVGYSWQQTGGPAVNLSDALSPSPSFTAPPVSGPIVITFELTVEDNDPYNPKSDKDTVVVNLRDINQPPSCELAAASVAQLWPPDHKMELVSIIGLTDQDVYNDLTLRILHVTQDEQVNGTGDGDSSPDASIQTGSLVESVLIRRERAGQRNGRVYRVRFTASDGFEACNGSVTVAVSRDRRGVNAIDDGSTIDSTSH